MTTVDYPEDYSWLPWGLQLTTKRTTVDYHNDYKWLPRGLQLTTIRTTIDYHKNYSWLLRGLQLTTIRTTIDHQNYSWLPRGLQLTSSSIVNKTGIKKDKGWVDLTLEIGYFWLTRIEGRGCYPPFLWFAFYNELLRLKNT